MDADSGSFADDTISAESNGEWKGWRKLGQQRPPKWWTSTQQFLQSFDHFMRLPPVKRIILSAVIALALLAWLLRIRTAYFPPQSSRSGLSTLVLPTPSPTALKVPSENESWTKPNVTRIIGFMYYGRRQTVEILECYLRKNLVSNGGFLDELHFIINTDNVEDLLYLSDIVSQVDEYKQILVDGLKERGTAYEAMLKASLTRGALMVKIDDDLVR